MKCTKRCNYCLAIITSFGIRGCSFFSNKEKDFHNKFQKIVEFVDKLHYTSICLWKCVYFWKQILKCLKFLEQYIGFLNILLYKLLRLFTWCFQAEYLFVLLQLCSFFLFYYSFLIVNIHAKILHQIYQGFYDFWQRNQQISEQN